MQSFVHVLWNSLCFGCFHACERRFFKFFENINYMQSHPSVVFANDEFHYLGHVFGKDGRGLKWTLLNHFEIKYAL